MWIIEKFEGVILKLRVLEKICVSAWLQSEIHKNLAKCVRVGRSVNFKSANFLLQVYRTFTDLPTPTHFVRSSCILLCNHTPTHASLISRNFNISPSHLSIIHTGFIRQEYIRIKWNHHFTRRVISYLLFLKVLLKIKHIIFTTIPSTGHLVNLFGFIYLHLSLLKVNYPSE